MVKGYIRDLKREFAGYNGARLVKDLMAGVTVAAVALPLALAFGISSGADAAAGLVTAIIGGFAMSVLSGASYQISGPTGAMTAVLISLVAKSGIEGMFVTCLIAGALLFLCGVFRLGRARIRRGATRGLRRGLVDRGLARIVSDGAVADDQFITF